MPFSSSKLLQCILINPFPFIFLTLHQVFCLLYPGTLKVMSSFQCFPQTFHVFRNDLPLISFYAQKADLGRLARRKRLDKGRNCFQGQNETKELYFQGGINSDPIYKRCSFFSAGTSVCSQATSREAARWDLTQDLVQLA